MKITQTQVTLALGILAAGVGYFMLSRAASVGTSAITTGLQAINPVSDQNVFYKAANAVTQSLTGDADTTLGTWLHQTFSGDDERVAAMLRGDPPANPAAPPVTVQSQLPDVVSNSNSGVNFNYF